jgi:hypothetical protein
MQQILFFIISLFNYVCFLIYKAVIIETKGSGTTNFTRRRKFVEGEFLKINKDKFGYDKFEYLYLTGANKMEENLTRLTSSIKKFFGL